MFNKFYAPMVKFALACLVAVASLGLSSCQDEDYGFTKEEVRAAVYDRNFIAKYGEIDPDQSWDLSRYAVGNTASSGTRALSSDNSCKFDNDQNSWLSNHLSIVEDWYYAEPKLISEFNTHLGEGVDNTSQGGPFSLSSNGTPFYILPIFQGVSGIVVDLHMVVTYNGNTYDKQIWTKGQNLQKQDAGSMEWKTVRTYDPWSTYGGKSEYEANYTGSTYGALATRTKPIKCMIPAGASIKFYLHVTQGHLKVKTTDGDELLDNDLAFTDSKQWSDQGKMIALNENFTVNQATKDRFGKETYIIGCEDASYGTESVKIYNEDGSVKMTYNMGDSYSGLDGSSNSKEGKITSWAGDNDMNDLVFMFIADELPEIVEEGVIQKRYLIEDLGSVADWDFNDIVVDLYQKSVDGEVVEQKAMLRHKCGTTDFIVKIGDNDNVFGRHQGEVQNTKVPMTEVEDITKVVLQPTDGVWPWNPDQNNIIVEVFPDTNSLDETSQGWSSEHGWNNNSSSGVHGDNSIPSNSDVSKRSIFVEFPDYGKVPRIIAVDTDFPWTDENEDIDPNIWTYYVIGTEVGLNEGSGEPGVVAGAGRYRASSKITLKALPNPGYEFLYWNDDHNNTNATREITVSNASTYTAIFKQSATPHQENYTINVVLDGNGANLECRQGNNQGASISHTGSGATNDPYVFTIPTVVNGAPNNDGLWLSATPPQGYYFSHWSDENGNVDINQSITVKSDANLIAHFVPANTLSIRIAQEDWKTKDSNHPIELYLKDGSDVRKLDIDANGMATKTVTNSSVSVIARVAGDNQWDAVFQWSEGVHQNNSNTYETQNVNSKWTNIVNDFDNVNATAKKEISVPAEGKVVTVGVTYQVLAFLTLKLTNNELPTISETPGDGEIQERNGVQYWRMNKNDAPWGSAKINGNARQLFLHKNSVFNLMAEANPGYHFSHWGFNIIDVQGRDEVLRNQSNSAANGMYYVDAVFEENTRRALTFNFDNYASGDVYSVTVNGKETVVNNGSVTYNIPQGANVKALFKYKNKDNNDTEYNAQFVLSGSGSYTPYGYQEIDLGAMPSDGLTYNVTPKYQVLAFINGDYPNNKTDIGTVKINGGGNPEYLERGSAVSFVAEAKSGYVFDGWYVNDSRVSTNTTYSPTTHNRELFVDARFVKQTLTFNIPSADASGVKISVNGTDVTLDNGVGSIEIASGTEIKVKASHSGNWNRKFDFGNNKVITDNGKNEEVSLGNMPGSNKTVDVTVLYQVKATVKPENSGSVSINGGGNQVYVARNTTVTMVATPNEGYRFTGWSNNLGDDFTLSVTNSNGTSFVDANFAESPLDINTNRIDYEWAFIDDTKAYDKFAYGGQQPLIDKLTNSTASIKFVFRDNVTGGFTLFTPKKEDGTTDGWTHFDPIHNPSVSNANSLTIHLSKDDISKIKDRGGIVLQNQTGGQVVITEVYVY